MAPLASVAEVQFRNPSEPKPNPRFSLHNPNQTKPEPRFRFRFGQRQQVQNPNLMTLLFPGPVQSTLFRVVFYHLLVMLI